MPIINRRKNAKVLAAQFQMAVNAGTRTLFSALSDKSLTIAEPIVKPTQREIARYGANRTVNGNDTSKLKPKSRKRWLSPQQLRQLSNSDPVTWSIKRAIKTAITMKDWDIIPDLAEIYKELDRWAEMASHSINEWDYACEYFSTVLSPEIVIPVRQEIKKILGEKDKDERTKRYRIDKLMTVVKDAFNQQAMSHARVVRGIFEQPNKHQEKSLRSLLELVVDDMLTFDSGIIIKNDNYYGDLAEMYSLPGEMIFPIIHDDGTVPQPPLPAYVYGSPTDIKGVFANDQLVRIVENMQRDGFGMSPIEVLCYTIVASMLGDQSYMNNLLEGAIPPLVINIGDVDEIERQAFEDKMYQQIDKTDGNRILIMTSPATEDGKVQVFPVPKGLDFRASQIYEYRTTLEPAVKCVAFGLTMQDVGLIINQELNDDPEGTAAALSDRRGVVSRYTLIEQYINAEIVKDDFPFDDVKFAFKSGNANNTNTLDEARADSVRIMNGTLTRNESREKIKLRPLPGGDVATIVVGNQVVQVDVLEPTESQNQLFYDQNGNVVDQMGMVVLDASENPLSETPGGQGSGNGTGTKAKTVKNNQMQPAKTSPATSGVKPPKSKKTDATRRKVENGE